MHGPLPAAPTTPPQRPRAAAEASANNTTKEDDLQSDNSVPLWNLFHSDELWEPAASRAFQPFCSAWFYLNTPLRAGQTRPALGSSWEAFSPQKKSAGKGRFLLLECLEYLHQALEYPDKDDAAVMHPGSRGDEHVQRGRQQDGGAKHSVETTSRGYGTTLPPKGTPFIHPYIYFKALLRGSVESKSRRTALQTYFKTGSNWRTGSRGFAAEDLAPLKIHAIFRLHFAH